MYPIIRKWAQASKLHTRGKMVGVSRAPLQNPIHVKPSIKFSEKMWIHTSISPLYAGKRTQQENTVALWQSRIRKKINKGNYYTALEDFYHMKERGLTPNKRIYDMIINALIETGDTAKATEIYEERLQHGYIDEEDIANEAELNMNEESSEVLKEESKL